MPIKSIKTHPQTAIPAMFPLISIKVLLESIALHVTQPPPGLELHLTTPKQLSSLPGNMSVQLVKAVMSMVFLREHLRPVMPAIHHGINIMAALV